VVSTGSVAAFLPLFLFAILFGLSMDYHVFIISLIDATALMGLAGPRRSGQTCR
jgi:RND superfamily putative drug exporter